MSITSQLRKMSIKTMEFVQENDMLFEKVKRLQIENSVLKDSEKLLAKRNMAHQKVIKMLVQKLKGIF